MNRRFFDLYQYLAPVILTPLGYWLWWRHYSADHRLTTLAFFIPVIFAYVVPGVGTNVLKFWEFNTRFRIGRFRPHHGFVFGSATSMLALLCIGAPAPMGEWWEYLRTGFVFGSVLGFWNWLYDIYAIRSGILRVYNQPYAEGHGPEAIATDYAPWFFGGFGFAYGVGLRLAERLLLGAEMKGVFFALFAGITLATIVLPVVLYIGHSRLAHGHNGCRPMHRLS